MIADRFGVVHENDKTKFEKKFQVGFGYHSVYFNQKKAEDICKDLGNGYVVEKISTTYDKTNKSEIIYRT